MNKLFTIALAALCIPSTASADGSRAKNEDAAFAALTTTTRFVVGKIGEQADEAPEQKLLKAVLRGHDREERLRALVDSGAAVPALFGLCGLRYLGLQELESAERRFRASPASREMIETQSGCEVFDEPALATLERIKIECAPENIGDL